MINGGGSLSVVSTKNGVKGCSVSIVGAALDIEADKDGIHAEIDAYDGAAEEPSPAYTDGGYVYLNGAEVTVRSVDDGIQADTFVNVTGNSALNILAGGGAPSSVTTASSDNASGKGIKAGQIDWTDASGNEADIDWDGYLIWIESGNITVNSNDDALHSNGELLIEGGSLTLSSGDDAVHSDNLLQITGGSIAIDKCYEGVESAKVEISGGTIEIESYEDGINAASVELPDPAIYNSPPEIKIVPLESTPSPSLPIQFTEIYPPEIIIWQLSFDTPTRFCVPSAALIPSS